MAAYRRGRVRRAVLVVVLGLAVVGLAGFRLHTGTWQSTAARFDGRVVRVAAVDNNGCLRTTGGDLVRLAGVSASANSRSYRGRLRELVGREVHLRVDEMTCRDRRGRVAAEVWHGGRLVNADLIAAGVVFADRRFAHPRRGQYVGLETAAVRGRVGLWANFPDVDEGAMPAWRREWLAWVRTPVWERGPWEPAAD